MKFKFTTQKYQTEAVESVIKVFDGQPFNKPEEMLEGDYLIRSFGFDRLKYNKMHFDVRKENKKVIRYHKMMGARIVGETELDYLFECTKEDYLNNIKIFGL